MEAEEAMVRDELERELVTRRGVIAAAVAAMGGFVAAKATEDTPAAIVRADDVIVVDDPSQIPAGTKPGQLIVIRS